jgi:hypothetical protein
MVSGGSMAASLWQRLACCLTGHDYAITSDRARMFLRCRACGRTSHGLDLSEAPFPHRSRADRTSLEGTPATAARSNFATR